MRLVLEFSAMLDQRDLKHNKKKTIFDLEKKDLFGNIQHLASQNLIFFLL